MVASGCSTPSQPSTPNPDSVRQHADKAFDQLQRHDMGQQQAEPAGPADTTVPQPGGPWARTGVQVPLAEIVPSKDDMIRAIGYGNLAKGLFLCQHSADLAARVELSKLVRVTVTERSTDRIRERTGKDAEQDIEVVREGLVNEVLSDVRIVDRKVDQEAGTCASTAQIPRTALFPSLPNSGSDIPASR
jgi:hypothetical protein